MVLSAEQFVSGVSSHLKENRLRRCVRCIWSSRYWGTWGGIATGLFATTSVNDAGANGLFYGDPSLLWKQLVAIVATYLFVGIATFIIVKVVGLVVSLRATQEEETLGLDITLHGERAYHESNM